MTLINKVNSLTYDVNILSYNNNISLHFMKNMVNVTNHNVAVVKSAINYLFFNDFLQTIMILSLFVLIYINTNKISQLEKKLKL